MHLVTMGKPRLKKPYTKLHLATMTKPLHPKTLQKYAPGYYEHTVRQKDTTQICTWLLRANRCTKRPYTNMHLVTMRKPPHEKTLHKYAPGYCKHTAPQKDTTHTTHICTWLL